MVWYTILYRANDLTGVLVADVDGFDTEGCRRIGNFLSMLVGAGLEEDPLTAHALVPRHHVRRDRFVRVTDVRVPCVSGRFSSRRGCGEGGGKRGKGNIKSSKKSKDKRYNKNTEEGPERA